MENAQMVQQTVKEVAKENERILQAINDTNRTSVRWICSCREICRYICLIIIMMLS